MTEQGFTLTFKRPQEGCPHDHGAIESWGGGMVDGAGNFYPSCLISRLCADCGTELQPSHLNGERT